MPELSLKYEQKIVKSIDGIGLYRTEIPFLVHNGFPSEEEQKVRYQDMLQLFAETGSIADTGYRC